MAEIFSKHKYFGGLKYQKYEGAMTAKKVANSIAKNLRQYRGWLARVSSVRGAGNKKYYQVYVKK